MAIYLVVACFAILHFPRRMGACGFKLAVAAAAYKVAASFGVEKDATATVALLLAVPALFRLYQFAITLLATFPLQLFLCCLSRILVLNATTCTCVLL